jgi:hypothetical protein
MTAEVMAMADKDNLHQTTTGSDISHKHKVLTLPEMKEGKGVQKKMSWISFFSNLRLPTRNASPLVYQTPYTRFIL